VSSISTAFRLCLIAAVAGIVGGTLYFAGHSGSSPSIQVVSFLVFGAVPIGVYYAMVRRKLRTQPTGVTDASIDLVYYLGFLITLTALLTTVISYGVFDLGRAKNPSGSVVFIAVSFGLSLAATAFALFARVDLVQRRDELLANHDAEDVLRDRIMELDEAYRRLSAVMSDASARFAAGLADANDVLTRQVGDVVEGARSRLNGFIDSASLEVSGAERAMREKSLAFAETVTAKSEELFERMRGVIEEARTSLSRFVQDAAMEKSSSALAKAVADVTASLVKAGEDLSALFKHLEALEGRAATAMTNVDALGASAQRASKSAAEVGDALGRVSSGAAALDLEPIRAGLAQLSQSVQRLESAAASAEQKYATASDRAVDSMRAKTEDLNLATKELSDAFVSVSTELSRSAAVLAETVK
jgi:cytochrome c556